MMSCSDKGEYTFKSSTQRKDPDLMFVPTNLHIQRIRVKEEDPGVCVCVCVCVCE